MKREEIAATMNKHEGPGWEALLHLVNAPDSLVPCGHPESHVASSDEGTSFYASCAFEAREAEMERVARLDGRIAELEQENAALRTATFAKALDALAGCQDPGMGGLPRYAYSLGVACCIQELECAFPDLVSDEDRAQTQQILAHQHAKLKEYRERQAKTVAQLSAIRTAFAPLAAQIEATVNAGAGHGDETVASLLLTLGEVRRMREGWSAE